MVKSKTVSGIFGTYPVVIRLNFDLDPNPQLKSQIQTKPVQTHHTVPVKKVLATVPITV